MKNLLMRFTCLLSVLLLFSHAFSPNSYPGKVNKEIHMTNCNDLFLKRIKVGAGPLFVGFLLGWAAESSFQYATIAIKSPFGAPTSTALYSSVGGESFTSISLTDQVYSTSPSQSVNDFPNPALSTVISSPTETTLTKSEVEAAGIIFQFLLVLIWGTFQNIDKPADYTTLKLQVALNVSNADDNNITKYIDNITKKYSPTLTSKNASQLLYEVATVLRDNENNWFSASIETYRESMFDRMKRDVRLYIYDAKNKVDRSIGNASKLYAENFVVVTLVHAIEGKGKCTSYTSSIKSIGMLRTCLQQIAVDVRKNGGNNVISAEVLWSPGMPAISISKWNLAEIYPELTKL